MQEAHKYKFLYTNINEFKFDTFNIEKEDVAFALDMDVLIVSLTELRTMYVAKCTDAELVARATELNLNDALFIIDEAHNYFDINNPILVWWLSYHRHLHQDIILITQNFSLIYRKYLSFAEYFYNAVSSSLRIRSSVFTYHQYVKYQLTKNSHTNTFKVKFNPAVYALYSSGANTQGNKVIQKFIAIAVFLLVVVVVFFKVFVANFGGSSDSNSTKQTEITLPDNTISINTDSEIFTVVCIGFDCSYMGQTVSIQDLNTYKRDYKLVETKTTTSGDIVFHNFVRDDKFLKGVFNVTLDPNLSN